MIKFFTHKSLGVIVNYIFFVCLFSCFLGFFISGNISKYGSIFLGFLVLFFAFLLSLLIAFLYKKLIRHNTKKLSLRKEALIITALAIIYLAFAFIAVRYFATTQQLWDPGFILHLAEHISTGQEIPKDDYVYFYFSAYPFQLFSGYFNGYYLKAMHHFCNLSNLTLLLALNAFYVLGSIAFCYLLARKRFGARSAIFLLFLFPFFVPILLYIPIIYTDTSSLFFLTGASFFSTLYAYEAKSTKKQLFFCALFVAFMTLAISFKITSAIYLIAFLLYYVFIKKQLLLRKLAILFLLLLIILVPSRIAISSFTAKHVNPAWKYPIVHWLYMGAYGDGGFSPVVGDTAYDTITSGQDTKAIELERAKEIIISRGLLGNIEHVAIKLSNTWLDGSYFVFTKLAREPLRPNSLVYRGVMGEPANTIIRFILDVMRISRFLVLLLAAWFTRKKVNWTSVIKIAYIGVFIFFLFWETRSRYTINYTPLLFILWLYGIKTLSAITFKTSKSSRHTKRRLP